ncbi:MAG: YdiU family protein [Burkholderiales bacterium]|nr:YdiU family protein [Burkholderiales bacterium]
MTPFGFDNSFVRDLPGAYVAWRPAPVPAPHLLFLNEPLAQELRLDLASLHGAQGAALFAGNTLPADAEPIAQAYAGHQFGGFSPRLGDGRALLLGELIDRDGRRRDIAYKGSGRTPFSRGGDGKAAVGPMLREALIGEAMHALGIPTTRALAVAATGEQIRRDGPLPGAVLTRVAASHLRVGTFQFFLAQGDVDQLRQLADYTIKRHDPGLADSPEPYLGLLRAVAERQARLIAQWVNVGFIHGVMNTDNMTISGETIDYGPCAFMEAYDPDTVFSSIDHGGRYAYANQPLIARWNLARLAETLLPLMADSQDDAAVQQAVARAVEVLDAFPAQYAAALLSGQRAKLGLRDPGLATRTTTLVMSGEMSDAASAADSSAASLATSSATSADDETDTTLIADWLSLLHTQVVDYTLAWRHLAAAAAGDSEPLRDLFADRATLDAWLVRWRERCARDDLAGGPGNELRAAQMRRVNPWVIPRNHRVELALSAATEGDLVPFEQLLAALRRPFDDTPDLAPYGVPAPASETAGYQTFCGT